MKHGRRTMPNTDFVLKYNCLFVPGQWSYLNMKRFIYVACGSFKWCGQ